MILGIDPGGRKPHALALYTHDGDLIETLKSEDISEIGRYIALSSDVFIETQYYGGNAATLILLAQRTGMIMGICELYGKKYKMIPPITWESWLKLPTKPRKSKKDPDRIIPSDYKWKKQHAQDIINKAKGLTGAEIEDEDIGAAVLIGWFGLFYAEGLTERE